MSRGKHVPDICPHCKSDLTGTEIPRESLERGYYGQWVPEDGPQFFSRQIGVEVRGAYDGSLFYQCPDCGGRWHRWPEGTYQHERAKEYVDA